MQLAVLSDIHANLEALHSVVDDLSRRIPAGLPSIVCLGDMVGYGADPEAVVAMLRSLGVRAVMGNHEMGVAKPGCRRFFNPQARVSVAWTAEKLSSENRAWLGGLPFFLSVSGCRMVHGLPPKHPTKYLHQATDDDLERILRRLPEDVCFVGHTHRLAHISLSAGELTRYPLGEGRLILEPGARHLVNAGAVGQPRDADPRAKYCLYDTRMRTLDVCFVPYDARKAANKILAAGLPSAYARRLTQEES